MFTRGKQTTDMQNTLSYSGLIKNLSNAGHTNKPHQKNNDDK